MTKRKRPCGRIRQQRIDELVRLRLEGVFLFQDVRDYVRRQEKTAESCWAMKPGEKPLHRSSIYRYLQHDDNAIDELTVANRKRMYRLLLARRNDLYHKAVGSGDFKTALAIIKDQSEMHRLYPGKQILPPLETLLALLPRELADSLRKQIGANLPGSAS